MPFVPYAAFLAGALLTLLLPVALLIALTVWYWIFSVRVPETPRESGAGTAPAAPDAALSHPTERAAAAQDV